MRTLARTLNELRRSLHTEFASRASFDAVSPYSGFEQRLGITLGGKEKPACAIVAQSGLSWCVWVGFGLEGRPAPLDRTLVSL
jgi:hypothetical protein